MNGAMSQNPNETLPATRQVSMGTLLWMTTAVALLMAHARTLGPLSVQLLGVCCVFWLVSAALFSAISRRPKEVLFWSALIVVEAFLAVSAVRALSFVQECGWGMVGAVCGGFVGARPVGHRVWGSLISAGLGGVAMLAVLAYYREPIAMEQWLDLVGAVVVGFTLWHFVDFMRGFLARSGQSHLVMAAWLTLSVLAGNWAVSYFGY